MQLKEYVGFKRLLSQMEGAEISGATNILLSLIKVLKTYFREYGFSSHTIEYIREAAGVLIKFRPSSPLIYTFMKRLEYFCGKFQGDKTGLPHVDKIVEWLDGYAGKIADSIERIAGVFSKRVLKNSRILTYGYSSTVYKALVKAADEKDIEVVVLETRPDFSGRNMAIALAEAGVKVTLSIDSAISHIIRDVDLVVMGAEAISSYGSVINKVGSNMVAAMAKFSRKRVDILTGSYKFANQTMWGRMVKILHRDPNIVLPDKYRRFHGIISVDLPAYEEVPSSYIDLIITEKGVIPPKAFIIIIAEEYPELLMPEDGGVYEF